MTTDSSEPLEPKEQTKVSASSGPARRAAKAAPKTAKAAPKAIRSKAVSGDSASAKPKRGFSLDRLGLSAASDGAGDLRLGFGLAFAAGAAATLFLFAVLAAGLGTATEGHILPGVHAGSVDLSGLTRDEAMAKLRTGYASLSQGEVTVTTPFGVSSITYQQIGRGPDVEATVDAALSYGHTGNAIADAASMIHAGAFGQDIPIVIQVDPKALAGRIHELVGASSVPARDAQATANCTAESTCTFSWAPSQAGRGIDERAIGATIIEQLTEAGAAADIKAGGTFVALQPRVSDADAQAAIARANKMMVDITLTWQRPPNPLPATWSPKSWTVGSALIRGWIVFGIRPDGSYGPSIDPAQVEDYLASISEGAAIPPDEPKVIWDASGTRPIGLTQGKDGVGVDVVGTCAAISAALDGYVSTGSIGPIEVVTGPIHPQTTIQDVASMSIIGQHTVGFWPGPNNGNGLNIRTPAKRLNGLVIGPGQQFSFLQAVGPIEPPDYTKGGVIVSGQSQTTGAMGGGICSASTTFFYAAVLAGLQIDERHAHFYWIDRYPIGLDATVYSNGSTVWDMKFTNDTPNPIVIRSWATYTRPSSITVQLWSWPTHRHVTWKTSGMQDQVLATNKPPVYVKTLKPGQTWWAEPPIQGFKITQTRTVTDDRTGAVINVRGQNSWTSVYTMMKGLVQIGATPTPAPTPTGGAPTPPPATLTPSPTDTPSPRRRRVA